VQIWNGYMTKINRTLIGMFKDVYVIDFQSGPQKLYAENVNAVAQLGGAYPYYTDELHATGEGLAAEVREVLLSLGNYGEKRYPLISYGTQPMRTDNSVYFASYAHGNPAAKALTASVTLGATTVTGFTGLTTNALTGMSVFYYKTANASSPQLIGTVNNNSTTGLTLTTGAAIGVSAGIIAVGNDFAINPRICEDDSKYNLIIDGIVNGTVGSNFIQLGATIGNGVLPASYIQSVVEAVATNAGFAVIAQYGVNAVGNVMNTASYPPCNSNIESGVYAFGAYAPTLASNGNLGNLAAGLPQAQNNNQTVRIFVRRPPAQKNSYDPNISIALASTTLTGVSISQTVQRAGAIGVITATAATAVTSGTIDVAVNGVLKATMTFTSSVNGAGSGVFFTAATAGLWLSEGDIVTCTFTLIGGSLPVIRLSNK